MLFSMKFSSKLNIAIFVYFKVSWIGYAVFTHGLGMVP